MNVEKNRVIGIDIGGTGTKIGIVDARGKILARDESIATNAYPTFEEYIDAIATVIERLIEITGSDEKIRGIGVGAPDSNYYTGNIEHAFNLPWKGVLPLARMLTERTGIPVRVTNDANAAAIGEMTYGTAKGMKNSLLGLAILASSAKNSLNKRSLCAK